jgi:hypothetical protein
MIAFANGVRLNPSAPVIRILLDALQALSVDHGRDYTVTSGHDSAHDPHSAHYRDEALDVRVHDVYDPDLLAQILREWLGPTYTVLYEGRGTTTAHLHLQLRVGAAVPSPSPAPSPIAPQADRSAT